MASDATDPGTESENLCSHMSIREERKRKKDKLLLDIPEDVICDILIRLPISSLLRLKSMNRYWNSLISSHSFAIRHLDCQANNAGPVPRRYGVIQVSKLPQQELPHVCLHMQRRAEEEQDSDTIIVESVGFPNPLKLLEEYDNANGAQVFGSCNGLLLVSYGEEPKHFILWNPSIGQDKLLPLNHFCQYPMTVMAGLGYDSSSDNYKVVAVVNDGDTQLTHVAIYNLKRNSWTMLEDTKFPYEFYASQPGITVKNGAPHWVLKPADSGGLVNAIVYFDLVEENFKELPMPDRLVRAENIFLGACKDFLCVGAFDYGYTKFNQIWIMKEYGVKESWTELMSIPQINSAYSILTFQHLMSLRFPKESEVLMILDWNSVAIFKTVGTQKKVVSFSGNQEGLIVTTYVESLISPHSYS